MYLFTPDRIRLLKCNHDLCYVLIQVAVLCIMSRDWSPTKSKDWNKEQYSEMRYFMEV